MRPGNPDYGVVLITAKGEDADWFPYDRTYDNYELIKLEGIRFRDCYLTASAIETGSAALFSILYRAAKIAGGRVLPASDYQGYDYD
jgi:hypothetical protein